MLRRILLLVAVLLLATSCDMQKVMEGMAREERCGAGGVGSSMNW